MNKVEYEKALDEGDSGPESPGTGQGTGNDSGNELVNETEILIQVPLAQGATLCTLCLEQGYRHGFLELKDLVTHFKGQHARTKLEFECRACRRKCPSAASWHAHKSKCKGGGEEPQGAFICEKCGSRHTSQRGLSTHERHAHPEIRNAKRKAQAEKPAERQARPGAVWSEEDTRRLIEYDREFQGDKHINKKIKIFFPTKTEKQISDKRRHLREKGAKAGDDATARNQEGREPTDEEGEAAPNETQEILDGEDGHGGDDGEAIDHVIGQHNSPNSYVETLSTSDNNDGKNTPTEPNERPTVELDVDAEPAAENATGSNSDVTSYEPVEDADHRVAVDERPNESRENTQAEPGLEPEHPAEAGEADYWRSSLLEYAESIALPAKGPIREAALSLLTTWREDWIDPVSLQDQVNDWVSRLGTLLLDNKPPVDQQNKKKSNETGKAKGKDIHHRGSQAGAAPNGPRRPNHAERKRTKYARCQDLFNNCPRKLALAAVSGDLSLMNGKEEPPPKESIRELYSSLWGVQGPASRPHTTPAPRGMSQVFSNISVAEVTSKIKSIKADSAAGLDQVRKAQLTAKGVPELLTILYNMLIAEEIFPAPWMKNRTTLIPKAGKDLADVRNWRPITIGSMVGRVFTAMIDRKLRSFIVQNERQKGFTNANGCQQNTLLLSEAVGTMKADTGGVLTILDVAKAFDTIPHGAIRASLSRKGTPEPFIRLIEKSYQGCTTVIQAANKETVEIQLKRGVKQGDPLSPLLFNLAIEELLEGINKHSDGLNIAGNNLAVMAFADDIVLIAKNKTTAQHQLQAVNTHLTSMGMALSIPKCQTFEIVPTNKSWYTRDPNLKINEETVSHIQPDEVFKYLGAKLSPWKGLTKGGEVSKVNQVIQNVRLLQLKPWQKMEILQTYILPRFIYELTVNMPAKGTLQMIDCAIRDHVKGILHLPRATTSGFLYTPKKDGGLGLIRFERTIRYAALKGGISMRGSSDPLLQGAMVHQEGTFKKLASELGMEWPVSAERHEKSKLRAKARESSEWETRVLQGQGVKDFRDDRIGNRWLAQPSLLKSSRFIDAIRLRTNTYGTRVALSKTQKVENLNCRKCGLKAETLGHILGECIHNKPARIKRHDDIKRLIRDRLAKKHTVFEEATVRDQEELKKPDLVVATSDSVLVLDVTVRYEKRNYLHIAAEEKIAKYANVAKSISTSIGKAKSEVVPIVVGSRGTMPKRTVTALKKLGFNASDLLTISLMALRSSTEIANAFMDYD